MAEDKGPQFDPLIHVNGKVADLRQVLPLKIGDWKKLEAQGITTETLAKPTITDTAKVLLYILNKANPSILEADVDGMTLLDPQVRVNLRALAAPTLDIPFSTPSI